MKSDSDTILIVEDDPYDSKLIIRAIKKARILNPVQLVRDGAEAIDYLDGQPPYDDRRQHPLPVVMLLDLKLPKKSGFEVLQFLRKHPTVSRLPVVVLTSSSEHVDINRAYDVGANSYLVKPVGSEALVEMVKKIELYWILSNAKPELE